ncbi:MAG: hypothetical protein J5912_01545, partial [Clostridia bacterium]|nr:hypothetical protein [Clostridia bacterium]
RTVPIFTKENRIRGVLGVAAQLHTPRSLCRQRQKPTKSSRRVPGGFLSRNPPGEKVKETPGNHLEKTKETPGNHRTKKKKT